MHFSLSLPPLVVLLLLAFLWLILLVLLVWFAFGPQRRVDTRTDTSSVDKLKRAKSRRAERSGPRPNFEPDQSGTPEPHTPPPQLATVRVVNSAERSSDPKPDNRRDKDAFDDFNQPDHRRDDLDF